MLPTKTFQNTGRDFGFLASEAPGRISRDITTLVGNRATDYMPGTVLGRSPVGAATVAAGAAVSGSAGTVGNGTVNTLTADAGAPDGVYQIRITNAAANGGAFEVIRPDGSVDGDGTVGVAYNGIINFTLTDGSNDWVEDDRIPVTVSHAAANGQTDRLNLAGLDGSQIAESILGMRQPAGVNPRRAAIVSRHCEVIDNLLIWPVGMTTDQKAKAIVQLAAKGIIVRLNV